ncbi:uncharacterized protein GGS25DRAFT_421207 [Hypoxylon fragiforme]|uniref:uncharacterized protein n=1 Tax=Hypoxylon fragiforme TaxID=63214 RepID=UPI0020C607B8|nr:uncharacterized protein GGS25DRAFT_421207 [Hypoxylon fragiforme]KAI2605211.1 hypothetical protein GGS25DRAFT_421207 [Hypoxylon fragiforme]
MSLVRGVLQNRGSTYGGLDITVIRYDMTRHGSCMGKVSRLVTHGLLGFSGTWYALLHWVWLFGFFDFSFWRFGGWCLLFCFLSCTVFGIRFIASIQLGHLSVFEFVLILAQVVLSSDARQLVCFVFVTELFLRSIGVAIG